MGEKPHALNPLIREGDCFSFVKLVSGFVSLKGVFFFFFFLKVRTEVPKGFFGRSRGGKCPLSPPPWLRPWHWLTKEANTKTFLFLHHFNIYLKFIHHKNFVLEKKKKKKEEWWKSLWNKFTWVSIKHLLL